MRIPVLPAAGAQPEEALAEAAARAEARPVVVEVAGGQVAVAEAEAVGAEEAAEAAAAVAEVAEPVEGEAEAAAVAAGP